MCDAPSYHVHIDCSNGLSAKSVYEACGSLAGEMTSSGEESNAIEEELLERLAGPHDEGCLPSSCNQHRWIQALLRYRQRDEQSITGISIPLLVTEVAIKAIQDLYALHPKDSTSEFPNHTDHDSVELAIVASIWWFHRLHIYKSVSCTPLRCTSSEVTRIPQLYDGLPIELIVDLDAKCDIQSRGVVSLDGLVLLRALLAMGSSRIAQSRPSVSAAPPMKLRCVATGRNAVSMLVGERLDATTKVGDAPACAQGSVYYLDQPDLWDIHRNLSLLESNVDDTTAEHLAFAMERLMQQDGVADCWITPIVMKKGRSAHTLHCLCRNEHCREVLQLLFRHVPTLGVRVQCQQTGLMRVALRRSTLTVPFRLMDDKSCDGKMVECPVDCKVGYLGAEVVSIKPEFDHCRRIALSHGGDKLTVSSIRAQVTQLARETLTELRRSVTSVSCTDPL
jgi:Protein of unknown function DUF111